MAITFGVVGVGGRGKQMYHDVKRLNWLRLEAFCDTNEEHLEGAADKYGVPRRYTRFEKMLESDVDFVHIATPPDLHAAMSIQALAAGKHVLCEIPTVVSVAEADELVAAVEQSDRMYMVAENFCFRRDIQAFARVIERGEFGRILYGRASYCHDDRRKVADWDRQRIRTWFRDIEQPRYITHALGPLLYLARDRVLTIAADGIDGRERFEGDKPFFTSAQCHTEKGAILQLLYSMGFDRSECCYSITGEGGTIESFPFPSHDYDCSNPILDPKPYRLTRHHQDTDEANSEWQLVDLDPGDPFNAYHGGGHWQADLCTLATFAEAVRDGRPPAIDVYQGVDMTLPGIAAVESMRNGGAPVAVSNAR